MYCQYHVILAKRALDVTGSFCLTDLALKDLQTSFLGIRPARRGKRASSYLRAGNHARTRAEGVTTRVYTPEQPIVTVMVDWDRQIAFLWMPNEQIS